MSSDWNILKAVGDRLDSLDIRFKLARSSNYISILTKDKRGNSFMAVYDTKYIHQLTPKYIVDCVERHIS